MLRCNVVCTAMCVITFIKWLHVTVHVTVQYSAHLVESEESEISHHSESTDTGSGRDLTRHLQTDLHYLQRVGEDHLGASSL